MAKIPSSINIEIRGTPPFGWVELIKILDAEDKVPVQATLDNPGWHLLHVGTGKGGQTTLTFGWGNPEVKERPKCVVCQKLQTDLIYVKGLFGSGVTTRTMFVGFPVCDDHTLDDLKSDQYVMNNLIVEV